MKNQYGGVNLVSIGRVLRLDGAGKEVLPLCPSRDNESFSMKDLFGHRIEAGSLIWMLSQRWSGSEFQNICDIIWCQVKAIRITCGESQQWFIASQLCYKTLTRRSAFPWEEQDKAWSRRDQVVCYSLLFNNFKFGPPLNFPSLAGESIGPPLLREKKKPCKRSSWPCSFFFNYMQGNYLICHMD